MNNSSNKMNHFIEKYYWFLFAGLAAFAAMLCFLRLEVAYVASWDEARHGVSAYEMIQNKNFIVNTYNYDVDYWNLKPPLSFYGIMLGFGIFGYSVTGLRFYSALSYFLICILCSLYVKKHHGKWSSLLTIAFLCCNQLMLALHGARAGDADALYQLFFTIAMLAMMEIPENKSRSYICGVCFSLAFLTKSYHAGIILVIGGLYMIISGQITKFKIKEWILFVLSMAIPAGVWGIARFTQDGLTFFMTMLTEDVLSRSSAASEGHTGSALFYIERYFLNLGQIYWILLLVILAAGIYMILKKKESIKPYTGYLLWLFVPLAAFSLVSTKLNWYNYPILVPLCMLAAIAIGNTLQYEKLDLKWKKIILTATLIAVGFYGYRTFDEAILSIHGDSLQTFIADSVEREEKIVGANAFIQVRQEMEDGSVWNQNNIFIAEIEGDFRCKPYGVSGYLDCNEKKVIYISREDYVNMQDILTGAVLNESEDYLMLADNLN